MKPVWVMTLRDFIRG